MSDIVGHTRLAGVWTLYVITDGEYQKIGITCGWERKRIADIQAMNPRELTVVLAKKICHARDYEAALHQYFKGKRVRGEWFRLDEDDINTLKSILDGNILQRVGPRSFVHRHNKPAFDAMFKSGKAIDATDSA